MREANIHYRTTIAIRSRSIALLAGGLALAASAVSASAQETDCLYSGVSNEPTRNCTLDPYRIAAHPMTTELAREIGVSLDRIQFSGCQTGRFSVLSLPGASANPQYVIRYPVSSRYSYDTYVGPIAHEFSHIAQLSAAGGRNELRAELEQSPDRIELGADFIAGIIFRRHVGRVDRAQFQNSRDLLGSYEVSGIFGHGTPDARLAAFRTGFFLNPAPTSIMAAHQMFQDDRYPGLVLRHQGR